MSLYMRSTTIEEKATVDIPKIVKANTKKEDEKHKKEYMSNPPKTTKHKYAVIVGCTFSINVITLKRRL